ncbi:nitroreductase family protein [Clostridium thailandense]|uniref:nitroreductase family protein n=1 Tax=Clostridium thailandense TaxID=2794346 RepID=UPI003988F762
MNYNFNEQDIKVLDRIIEARRSVRVFKEEIPSDSMIKAVIQVGVYAPYAGLAVAGEMDLRRFFVIKKDNQIINSINEIIKATAKSNLKLLEKSLEVNPFLKEKSQGFVRRLSFTSQAGLQDLTQAPCFIIIAERKGMPPVEKQSLAHTMQNMWLKATVLGLGFRLISMIENLSESNDFCKLLGLPYGEFAFNGCIIGYQVNEPTKRNRMSLENSISWL